MKVDLHCHTSPASPCSRISPEELVKTARERGLDGIAITDHFSYPSDEEVERLCVMEPSLKIFRGAEISLENPSAAEGWEDIVVIADEDPTFLHPIRTDSLEDFKVFARDTGALVIHAHPFRYHDSVVYDVSDFRPDAVEIASSNIGLSMHEKICAFCRANGLKAVATSDAHRTWVVGLHYVALDFAVDSERALADAVRSGAFTMESDAATFEARREKLGREEALARRVLFEGGDVHGFLGRGGMSADVFQRVANGETSLLNEKALGLRNPV